MITSNAGAEFTTKTTIIVVLGWQLPENPTIRPAQMVLLGGNKHAASMVILSPELHQNRNSTGPESRIGGFVEIPKCENESLKAQRQLRNEVVQSTKSPHRNKGCCSFCRAMKVRVFQGDVPKAHGRRSPAAHLLTVVTLSSRFLTLHDS